MMEVMVAILNKKEWKGKKEKEKSEKEGLPHGGSGLPPLQLLIEDRSKPALTTCNIFINADDCHDYADDDHGYAKDHNKQDAE